MTEALWHAVRVTLEEDADTESEQVDLLSALVLEIGSQGIEIRDEEEPPQLLLSFPPDTDSATLPGLVKGALEQAGLRYEAVEVETVEPVDWANHYKSFFVPLRFGRLWVVPSWLSAPDGAERVLWIDPSSAFGTGLHATTAMCLERIDALEPKARVLDVGTGTGILAMAAIRAGAPSAVGIDNDPEAVRVAEENAAKNDLTERLELSGRDVSTIEETFELVVANILAGPLAEMAPTLARTVAPGGRLVLSGILGTQADEVTAAYLAAGLVDPEVTARDEWVRIELRRAG